MKTLKLIAPIICLLFVEITFANVGEKFPELVGENLENKSIELPKAAKGKYCLIGMASSKKG